MKFRMMAPCLFGLEKPVADELKAMDAENVTAENGRVFFEGDEHMIARANICSRFAERVQIVVGEFDAHSFAELFDRVKALPWERFIRESDAFPVKGWSINSQLHSVPDCQAIIKKAVVSRLSEKYHIERFKETGAKVQIAFSILKNRVTVTVDTSGEGLHKRGYRRNANDAPLKETLAAALVWLSRIYDDSTLYDPCCGSGTILIEGAMIARNMAPGLRRSFAAESFGFIPDEVWRSERERALSAIKTDIPFRAKGSDIDPEAVALTLENAKKAGVDGFVEATVADVADFAPTGERAVVVTNPPYGERLLDEKQAERLYSVMGRAFVQKRGYKYTVISSHDGFEHAFGRTADKRRKLYNGSIKCQAYFYFR